MPKTPRGGGGALNLDKNGGDNTFCPGMGGGHEILTWNGGGAGKYHFCLGEGGGETLPKKNLHCARKSPNFKVLTTQIGLFALIVIQIRDIQWQSTLNLITSCLFGYYKNVAKCIHTFWKKYIFGNGGDGRSSSHMRGGTRDDRPKWGGCTHVPLKMGGLMPGRRPRKKGNPPSACFWHLP